MHALSFYDAFQCYAHAFTTPITSVGHTDTYFASTTKPMRIPTRTYHLARHSTASRLTTLNGSSSALPRSLITLLLSPWSASHQGMSRGIVAPRRAPSAKGQRIQISLFVCRSKLDKRLPVSPPDFWEVGDTHA
jgi:hypothetical protein